MHKIWRKLILQKEKEEGQVQFKASLQPQLDIKKEKIFSLRFLLKKYELTTWSVVEVVNEKGQRCKYPDCKGKSQMSCGRCLVFLCLNKDSNCFNQLHTE